MIKSFAHKGLAQLFDSGTSAGVRPDMRTKLVRLLDLLSAARQPADMDLPGLRLHELQGKRKGTFSIWVNGNYRLTFAMADGNATNVNLEDYH